MKTVYRMGLLLLAILASSVQAQMCTQFGAGPGSVDTVTINHSGVDRYYCVYKPSSYPLPNPHRVVFVFHGGGGNASILMDPAKRFLQNAESENYVAVFAQGSSRANCGRDLSATNNWTDQDCSASSNIGFTREMIQHVMLDYSVEPSHIQLAGFSGGAKHIYRMISGWQDYDPVIRSFATMAGSMHKTTFKADTLNYETVNVLSGVPTNALLFQGGSDIRVPTRGGLSSRRQEILASFWYKVDNFVALNSTRTPAGDYSLSPDDALRVNPVPVAYPLGPSAPAGAAAERYPTGPTPRGDAETVAVLSPSTPHSWQAWMSDEAFSFFSRF